jgi:predicted DNA-binding protein (UPF0251 family)
MRDGQIEQGAQEAQRETRSEILARSEQWGKFTRDVAELTDQVSQDSNRPIGQAAVINLRHTYRTVVQLRRRLARRFGVRAKRFQSESSGAVQWSRWNEHRRINKKGRKEIRMGLHRKLRLMSAFRHTYGEWMRAQFIFEVVNLRMTDALDRMGGASKSEFWKELDNISFQALQEAAIESVILSHTWQVLGPTHADLSSVRWPAAVALAGAVRAKLSTNSKWRLGQALEQAAGPNQGNRLLLDELPGVVHEVLSEERPEGKQLGNLKDIKNAVARRIEKGIKKAKEEGEYTPFSALPNDDLRPIDGDTFVSNEFPMEEEFQGREWVRQILEGAKLSKREGEVFALRLSNPDWTEREIGEQLGIGRGSVTTLLSRAKVKIAGVISIAEDHLQ